MIREVEEKDLETLWLLDKLAFTEIFGEKFNRNFEILRNNFEICNGGAFLYEKNNEILGFILSRALGTYGWIGTIVVHPQFQGRGIGKNLINRAISYLEEVGCYTIGLETLNRLYKNIEVYLRHGFYSINPSFQLGKTIDAKSFPYKINYNRNTLDTLSSKALKGYNPSVIYENALKNSWGDVIEISDGEVFALALLEKTAKLDKDGNKILTVYSLLVAENNENKIKNAIDAVNSYGKNNGFTSINFFINSANAFMLKILLKNGYFIKDSRTRMLIKGAYIPESPECSRWIL